MLSSLVAGLVLGVGQDADPKLNFETPGMTMTALAAELTKATGQPHAASDEMKGQLVALVVKGMPASELKAKVAEATYGQWLMQTGGATLALDKDRIRRERTEANRKRAEGIRESKAGMRAMLAGTFRLPEELAESQEYITESWGTPSARLWMLAALQIPDTVLTDIQGEERIVFSTSPTRMQRGISANGMAPLVGEWLTKHNEEVEAALKEIDMGGGDDDAEFGAYMKMIEAVLGDSWKPKKIEGQPAKVIAVVTPGEDWDESDVEFPGVEVRLLDSNGKTLISEQHSIRGFTGELKEMIEYERMEREQSVPVDGDDEGEDDVPERETIPVRKEVVAYRQNLMSSGMSGQEKPRDPAAMAMILDPVQYDPVVLLAGEPAVAYAKKKGLSLVAALSDTDFSRFFWSSSEGGVPELYVSRMLFGEKEPMTEGLVVRGLDDPDDYLRRVDRADMGVLLRLMVKEITIPLDTMAAFAARNPKAQESGLWSTMRNSMGPDADEFLGGSNSWDALRLWGSLSSAQQKQLRSGGRVSLGALSQGARAVLNERVYGATSDLKPVASLVRKPVWEEFSSMMAIGFMEGAASGALEPTEVVPTGLPAQGYLASSVVSEKYLVQTGPNGEPNQLSMPMGVNELAFVKKMLGAMPAEASDGVSLESFNRMVMGERAFIDLVAVVAPDLGTTLFLNDPGSPDRSKTYTMAQLPAEFAADLAAAEQKLEASPMLKMMIQMMSMGQQLGGGTGERIKP